MKYENPIVGVSFIEGTTSMNFILKSGERSNHINQIQIKDQNF
jgi:hypothetical protein